MTNLRKSYRFTGRNKGTVRLGIIALPVFLLAILMTFVACSGLRAAAQTAQGAQTAITGEWVAQTSTEKPGDLYFMLQRHTKDGDTNMSSRDIPLGEFQGLAADALTSAKTNVSFSIAREAGTFQCEGYFNQGKGAGTWTLIPNPKFISAMRERGYTDLSEQNLISAAMNNITVKFSDDLKGAGYDHLTFEELRRAATHSLTPQYIREMRSLGYDNLSMEELVRARNHNIDAAYLQEVSSMGFENQPLDTVISLRNHNINAAFIGEMKAVGFENLTVEDLFRLRTHDITPAFVNEIKAEGYADISADLAVRLKNHSVNGDFIRRAKAQGYNVSLDEMIRLRNKDVVK
jgi:uncharacterized protein (UPF0335 family)